LPRPIPETRQLQYDTTDHARLCQLGFQQARQQGTMTGIADARAEPSLSGGGFTDNMAAYIAPQTYRVPLDQLGEPGASTYGISKQDPE
jgi:hypothetical protein